MTTASELQLLILLLTNTLGHRPSPATIWRWKTKGVKVGDERVKLKAIRCGGKLYGTPEDVDEFIRAQNPQPVEADDDARAEATQNQLEAAGLI